MNALDRDERGASQWESEADATASGRPARRYYEVTPHGKAAAQAATERYPLLARLLPERHA